MSKPTTVFMARIALENLNEQLLGVEAVLHCLSNDAQSDLPVSGKYLSTLADFLENAVSDARSSVRAADALLADSTACGGDDGP